MGPFPVPLVGRSRQARPAHPARAAPRGPRGPPWPTGVTVAHRQARRERDAPARPLRPRLTGSRPAGTALPAWRSSVVVRPADREPQLATSPPAALSLAAPLQLPRADCVVGWTLSARCRCPSERLVEASASTALGAWRRLAVDRHPGSRSTACRLCTVCGLPVDEFSGADPGCAQMPDDGARLGPGRLSTVLWMHRRTTPMCTSACGHQLVPRVVHKGWGYVHHSSPAVPRS